MTRGRRRIELRDEQVGAVTAVLAAVAPSVADDSAAVLADLRGQLVASNRQYAAASPLAWCAWSR